MAGVRITETVLRDAHQSLIATRMKTEDMLPIVEKLDNIGYHSLEAWGGATFDSCMRFLNEDPWMRLRKIKDVAKKTPLQMLLRGQNLLGYKHYADDTVEYFVQKAIANGIDIMRIFDALNDARNLETAINACKKEGGHAQGCICYTISPVHNLEVFVKDAIQLESMGADSICIKDMAGLLVPYQAYELVKALKESVKIPIQLHAHYTSGVASMAYLKAIEAGVDAVDCAISPMSMGTSQPPTEPLAATLMGTEFDTGLDLEKLSEIADYFRPLKEKYIESGLLDVKVMGFDVNTLIYQVPGGMLSNLVSQLKQSNALDKFEEVLKEVPRVRADFGYPPLVTPSSQIVGTQAVLNVLTGERYKMVPRESKGFVKGEYGRTPAPVSDEIKSKILGSEEPIACRPAELIEPELEKIQEAVKDYIEQDEDILSYAMLPQVAEKFFKQRIEDRNKAAAPAAPAGINPEVVAAISAVVNEMGERDGREYRVGNIYKINQNQNRWSLYGMLDRFRTKI
ncbi:Conserved carboxylase region [Ruminiclostridium papyrosolvens DSM 2782]|uniref:Conserved carboxylase region n=1 Tax=Ruminiclostridium papyrosolvens DSM 2782 TaxID=588581 RepID=F1T9Z8_9FIRM|nr:oxaloacetate decarboxylase subunit alpha [Ruminiclostridium papyrosolvens]EGD48740.1 Conserved carboxylase region [Ruminiclostridium papyrosolvens DSM 2782]WES32504.1 oxaloacetate decarboxylase subunit alpha [Ruminiclostridium papyrosolvens DSM 2782]